MGGDLFFFWFLKIGFLCLALCHYLNYMVFFFFNKKKKVPTRRHPEYPQIIPSESHNCCQQYSFTLKPTSPVLEYWPCCTKWSAQIWLLHSSPNDQAPWSSANSKGILARSAWATEHPFKTVTKIHCSPPTLWVLLNSGDGRRTTLLPGSGCWVGWFVRSMQRCLSTAVSRSACGEGEKSARFLCCIIFLCVKCLGLLFFLYPTHLNSSFNWNVFST